MLERNLSPNGEPFLSKGIRNIPKKALYLICLVSYITVSTIPRGIDYWNVILMSVYSTMVVIGVENVWRSDWHAYVSITGLGFPPRSVNDFVFVNSNRYGGKFLHAVKKEKRRMQAYSWILITAATRSSIHMGISTPSWSELQKCIKFLQSDYADRIDLYREKSYPTRILYRPGKGWSVQDGSQGDLLFVLAMMMQFFLWRRSEVSANRWMQQHVVREGLCRPLCECWN